MESKLYFGKYLISQNLAGEGDVLEALHYQSEMTPSFIDMSCKLSVLDMKEVYEILTYQADTDLSFEEAAHRAGYITEEQIVHINQEREKLRPHLGDILVHFNKIPKEVMYCEIQKYQIIKEKYHDVFRLLSNITIFKEIGSNILESLAYIASIETYNKDEIIYQQDDVGKCFYCVYSGTLKVTRSAPNSNEQIYLYTIRENDIFGEAALFEESRRSTNIVTITEATLVRFERDTFLNFLKHNHKASYPVFMFIVKRLYAKLQMANSEIESGKKHLLHLDKHM
ncbi:MAG: cyclic nucleotide-binding domain-containing protein [Candidatus Magnetoovum sp. WYHC-5]|nr:cyclic nucleotide-binding domain-containing protein [Candidatus Magnetoovum sp. WYHC-5]